MRFCVELYRFLGCVARRIHLVSVPGLGNKGRFRPLVAGLRREVAVFGSGGACPHGVQFYDIVVDGKRHARAAWSYEAPRPQLAQVAGRFGFWEDVEVK